MSDEQLLTLLSTAPLTKQQRNALTWSQARYVETGRMPASERIRLRRIAIALGLLPRPAETLRQPRPHGAVNLADGFSTSRTAGTEYAERLLAKPLPKRPPNRAA
jgi:hypothetical protein